MENKMSDMKSKAMAEYPDVDFAAGRRAFMRNVGLGAVGAAALGAASIGASTPAAATASVDIQILTFALNLEYLESSFYLMAYNGSLLPAGDRGSNSGTVMGGRKVNFQIPAVAAYAAELAVEEQKHVEFLRSAIIGAGLVPASMPNLNIDGGSNPNGAFYQAAAAAGLGTGFDAYASDANFLLASYIFEDVGVTAYHGALTMITNKTYLDAASGIMATEAYHAGIVRTSLFSMGLSSQTQAISFLRAKLTGWAGTPMQNNDHGVGTFSAPSILDADGNAIAADRSVNQVLNVVYGDSTMMQKPGLFFPNGVNPPT